MSGISQDTRNALNRALFFRRAKLHCKELAFSCFLDEVVSEPAAEPTRAGRSSPAEGAELVVNESFRYQQGSVTPDAIRDRAMPLNALLPAYPLAWVEDPATCMWNPFWARAEWAEALEMLRPGRPAPAELSPEVRRTLAMANILVSRDHEAAQRAWWGRAWQAAREQIQSSGYAIVRDLMHPLQVGAVRKYYRALVADGRLPKGDSQVAERYGLHSEPFGSFVHPQLTRLVSRLADEPLKPSYIYFACYQPGSALPRHTDREQCEFSVSLLVDFLPDRDGPCGWPLLLEDPRAPGDIVPVDLSIGDAVFYRGREILHSRDRLPQGHQSSSLFLHYVREDFAGDLW
jgi:hypothetical protein